METKPNSTISKILGEIRTIDDENSIRGALEILEESLYTPERSFEETLRTRLPLRISHAVREVLGENTHGDGGSKKIAIEQLRAALGKIRILQIEIAFEPNEEILEQMSTWAKTEIGEHIVLEIRLDRTMVGGARLVFGGKYREIALGELLRKTLERERVRVLAKLRTVSS